MPILLPQCASGALRERLIEYMGGSGDDSGSSTCAYITRCDDGPPYNPAHLCPPGLVDRFLCNGQDVARSLHDRFSILLHLDMEYVDFDDSLAAFRDPVRAFELQEPVVRAVRKVLSGFGIQPFHFMTGQGHHFVWRVAKHGKVGAMLRRLIFEGRDLSASDWAPVLLPHLDLPTRQDDEAFFGVGLVMEFLAQRVLRSAAKLSQIPVALTALAVGPGASGRREVTSLDLSEYGDPLQTRTIRMPFTPYHKAQRYGVDQEPPLWTMPLSGLGLQNALALRSDAAAVKAFSRKVETSIPEQSTGTERLILAYLGSPLRRFHEYYFSAVPDPPEIWDQTYRQTPVGSLPPCVRRVLEQPNDWLLQPAGLQLALRSLVSQGWHPRHVAGLFHSIFANPDHGWEDRWEHYDPFQRADFYCRIFGGLLALKLDDLVDFNCVSTQEKGFCLHPEEPCELNSFRESLLNFNPL